MSSENRRVKRQLRTLQSTLDYLEEQNPASLSGLYAKLLAGTLVRSLLPHYELAKSLPRAKKLGIAVDAKFVPEREKPLLRKSLKAPKFQYRSYPDDYDDREEQLI